MSSFLPLTSYNFEAQAAAYAGGSFVGNTVSYARDPTTTDISGVSGSFLPGQLWFSTSSENLFYLEGVSSGTIATWGSLATQNESATFSSITVTGQSSLATASGAVANIGGTAGGNININSGNAILINGMSNTASINLNSQVGANAATLINIGGAGQTGAITIGSSTAALTISLLNGVAASAQTLNIASGTSSTAAQTVNLLSGTTPGASTTLNIMDGAATAGTQTVNILATGATRAGVVNIGTGAAAHALVIGSTAASAATTIQAGSGTTGLNLNPSGGNIQIAPATVTTSVGSLTLNARFGSVTWTGLTTASGGFIELTLTNSFADVGKAVQVTVSNDSGAGQLMALVAVQPSSNLLYITMQNQGVNPLSGNVYITFWIYN